MLFVQVLDNRFIVVFRFVNVVVCVQLTSARRSLLAYDDVAMMWGSSTRYIHQRGKLKLTLWRYFANVERVIESTYNAGPGSVIRTSLSV
jgi:hypothetical protein